MGNTQRQGMYTFRWIVLCMSIVVSLEILYLPAPREGLGLLFLMPAAAGIMLYLFWNKTVFDKNSNIGLYVLLFTVLFRYIVSPLLIAISQETMIGLDCSRGGFIYAIIISIFELFVILFSLQKNSKKYNLNIKESEHEYGLKPTLLGIVAFLGFVMLLVIRGNLGNVFSHMSFLFHIVKDTSDLYTYDSTCFIALKAIVFLAVSSGCYQRYKKNHSIIWVVIAIAFGIGNIMFYDYSQRALLMEICLATYVSLTLMFTKAKKTLLVLFAGTGLLIVTGIFITRTLGFENGILRVAGNSSALTKLSNTVEAYINGISNIAYSIDTYEAAAEKVSFMTFVSDILRNLGFLSFPGLRAILKLAESIPDSSAIFTSMLPSIYSGYIIPPCAQANYFFTPYLGWIFDGVYFYYCIKLMCRFHNKVKETSDIVYVYVWTFLEIICSLCICYNFKIMLHTFTYIPMYMLIIHWFNKLGRRIKFTFGGTRK